MHLWRHFGRGGGEKRGTLLKKNLSDRFTSLVLDKGYGTGRSCHAVSYATHWQEGKPNSSSGTIISFWAGVISKVQVFGSKISAGQGLKQFCFWRVTVVQGDSALNLERPALVPVPTITLLACASFHGTFYISVPPHCCTVKAGSGPQMYKTDSPSSLEVGTQSWLLCHISVSLGDGGGKTLHVYWSHPGKASFQTDLTVKNTIHQWWGKVQMLHI